MTGSPISPRSNARAPRIPPAARTAACSSSISGTAMAGTWSSKTSSEASSSHRAATRAPCTSPPTAPPATSRRRRAAPITTASRKTPCGPCNRARSKRRTRLLQERLFLRRRGASETGVAMREAAEPGDDRRVPDGEVEIFRIAERREEFERARLIGQVFGMLKRDVDEAPLLRRQLPVDTLGNLSLIHISEPTRPY